MIIIFDFVILSSLCEQLLYYDNSVKIDFFQFLLCLL